MLMQEPDIRSRRLNCLESISRSLLGGIRNSGMHWIRTAAGRMVIWGGVVPLRMMKTQLALRAESGCFSHTLSLRLNVILDNRHLRIHSYTRCIADRRRRRRHKKDASLGICEAIGV